MVLPALKSGCKSGPKCLCGRSTSKAGAAGTAGCMAGLLAAPTSFLNMFWDLLGNAVGEKKADQPAAATETSPDVDSSMGNTGQPSNAGASTASTGDPATVRKLDFSAAAPNAAPGLAGAAATLEEEEEYYYEEEEEEEEEAEE